MGRHPKSAEVRGRFWTARASGATLREAVHTAGVSRTAGHYWLKESGGVRPRPKAPPPALRLSLAEREEISRGLAKGEALTSIAFRLGRSVSTVSREVRRNTTLRGTGRTEPTGWPKRGPGVPVRGSSPRTSASGDASRRDWGLGGRPSRSRPGSRGLTGRSDHAGVARDDLHVPVRPGQGRSAWGAHGPSSDPPGETASAATGCSSGRGASRTSNRCTLGPRRSTTGW